MTANDIRQFEEAFSMHISSPVAECDCGQVFWDSYNTCYDWSDGERETLEANPKAHAVRHVIERIELEGHIYCMDCICWHTRAARIVEWMRNHQASIGEWFRLERRRLIEAASSVPEVEQ